jgi:hypothetical protein
MKLQHLKPKRLTKRQLKQQNGKGEAGKPDALANRQTRRAAFKHRHKS